MFDIPYAMNECDISLNELNQISIPISVKIVEADYEYSIEVIETRRNRNRNINEYSYFNSCKILTTLLLSIIIASSFLHLINK